MNKKSGRVTIYDIARKCGVSVATVSRVINHPGEVSEETRDRIIEAMEELGFSYDTENKSVKKNRGVIILDNAFDNNPFYDKILEGIYDYSMRVGYVVSNFTEPFLLEDLKKLTRLAKRKSVVGFISLGRREKLVLKELSYIVPVIQCMEWQDPFIPEIPSVTTGVHGIVNKAMAHLYNEGAQKIVLFDYMLNTEYGRQVMSAYKSISKAHGLEDSTQVIFSKEGFEQAYIQAISLLQTEVPDAVLCASDDFAVSVLRAADRLGISVPRSLKICGVGNMRYGQYNTTPITTVSGIDQRLGEAAVRKLTEYIANPYADVTHEAVTSEIIVRNSTASIMRAEIR
ncbi:MAG: LacI family transcriptional regulator [Lachnospiraceae bacterium]|nr:LacI family transcriptional regulator [Lachnospiraceae bacterium]